MIQPDLWQQRHQISPSSARSSAVHGAVHAAIEGSGRHGVVVLSAATLDPLARRRILSLLRRLSVRLVAEAEKHVMIEAPVFRVFEGVCRRWMLIGAIEADQLGVVDALFGAPELAALKTIAAVDAHVLWSPDGSGG